VALHDWAGWQQERAIIGVPRGYSLALHPLTRGANALLGWPERLACRPWSAALSIDRPIFVIGAFRSGTTLLEQILAGHPQVGHFSFFTNACHHIPVIGAAAMRWYVRRRLVDEVPQPYLHNPRIDLTPFSAFECEWVWAQAGKNLWDPRCADLTAGAEFHNPRFEAELASLIRRQLLVQRAQRFLNKNPVHLLRLGYLHRLFPDARFIYLLREPEDTVRSHYRMVRRIADVIHPDPAARRAIEEGLHLDVLTPRIKTRHYAETLALNAQHPLLGIAHQWREMHLTALETLEESPGLAQQTLLLRYEALLANPVEELQRIWRFIDLAGSAADTITRRHAGRLQPPPPTPWSKEELAWQERLCNLVAPVAPRFARLAAQRGECTDES
jgi:hypothetical protein